MNRDQPTSCDRWFPDSWCATGIEAIQIKPFTAWEWLCPVHHAQAVRAREGHA